MDAKPNVLNKILPCNRIIPLTYFTTSGALYSSGNLLGTAFSATSLNKLYMECELPKWIKLGADAILKSRGFPPSANNTGSDKAVRLYMQYTITGKTGLAGSSIQTDPFEITIPDNEQAKTLHVTELLTLSTFCPDDIFCINIIRDAAHENDTWTDTWIMLRGIYFEILCDKIGEK